MLNNFLVVTSENAANGYPKHIGIGEAAIDALLGFLVVFIGIALLVGIIWLVGYIMRKVSGKAPQKAEKKQKPAVVPKETPVKESDGLCRGGGCGYHRRNHGVLRERKAEVRIYGEKNQENLRRK